MTDDAPTLGFAKDRVNTVLERLEAMVAGDEQQQVSLSSLNDELDAIAFGINALADELRWANARVTDAERRLAADLRISRDRAERANESKTIFLRTASHEIRTPIAAILGIATHQIPNLFEPFGQLDSSIAGLTGGTGLGLALSQRLAEQLGGTLSLLHSEPGKGSTFRLMLEIRCVERTATVSSTGRRAVSKRPPKPMLDGVRVLLADDNSDLRMAIGRALRLEGAVMSYASNGREALEMAQSGEHEVVLMDVKMPLMSGLDATRALRAAGYQLPIVALSADSTTESRTASIAAGCSAYLTKPFDPGDLIASIRGVRSATTTS